MPRSPSYAPTRPAPQNVAFVMLYAGPLLMAVAGHPSGSTGGAETQVVLLARELARRGHRVTIAAFDVPPGLPDQVEGIAIRTLPPRPRNGSNRHLWSWRLRFARALGDIDGDVFIQRGAGEITGLVGLVSFLRRRAFLYSSSTVIDFDSPRTSPMATCLLRLGIRLANLVVVQSNEQHALCRQHWRQSAIVIRSLVEPAEPRTETPEGFLWIGRLAPYKRPDAFVELAERLPDAAFWMVGTESVHDRDAAGRVRTRASRLTNLAVLDPRPRPELDPLYRRAVAVVSTSDREGMPNVLLEGWARGVPALVLQCDPDGIIARHGLGWNADGSIERLTEAAADLWRRRKDQADVARRCLEYVHDQHDMQRCTMQWEEALRLARRRRRRVLRDHAGEIEHRERFEFGRNWKRFLSILDESRIVAAERSLTEMLEVDDLRGLSFLDVGSGSGLFSLAAMRLGAERVHSLDVDPGSIACTTQLRRRYFPGDQRWTIEQASVLDAVHLRSLGQWEVVYSWGVLHHTGDLWRALANVDPLVAPGGRLFLAIYNDQGPRSRLWRAVKRTYNRLPSGLRVPFVVVVMLPRELLGLAAHTARLRPGRYLDTWRRHGRRRGMSRWHDLVDWVGGYPFEVAAPEAIFDFYRRRGFTLERLVTRRGIGCNQFVLRRAP